MRIRTLAAAICVALLAGPGAWAETVVRQITNPLAVSAQQMFRFDPQILRLSPGDSVSFENSLSDHTVHSIPEIWPTGAPEVHISHQPTASVSFDRPGVYGITCARHGQYGMVMLILVGDPDLSDAAAIVPATKLTPDAKKELAALFQAVAQGG